MRIVGIDPGSLRTGYGCVETDGRRHRLVTFGAITASAGDPFPTRLARIHRELVTILAKTRPDCVAVESVFHAVNARSALKLGHARGVALLAAYAAGVGVPFLLASFYLPMLTARTRRFARVGAALQRAAGGVMALMGLALMTGELSRVAVWLLETFPVLGRIG